MSNASARKIGERRTFNAIILVSTQSVGKACRPLFKVQEGVVFRIKDEPQAICDDRIHVIGPVLHEGRLIDLVGSTPLAKYAVRLFDLLLFDGSD